MTAVQKLQSIATFLKQYEAERFAPALALLQSLRPEHLDIIKRNQSNMPAALHKNLCQTTQVFVNCNDSTIQIVRASRSNHLKLPAIETLTLVRKTNFFNPDILSYTVVADQLHAHFEFGIESLSGEDIRLQAKIYQFCVAKNKPEEHALIAKNYTYKHQNFYNPAAASDFNQVGYVYESKPSITLHTLSHEAFQKLVGLKKEQTFDR